MQNVHPTLQPLLRIPGAPPPINADKLQAARAQAWREVQQVEAQDRRTFRAVQDQQQYLQSLGQLS